MKKENEILFLLRIIFVMLASTGLSVSYLLFRFTQKGWL